MSPLTQGLNYRSACDGSHIQAYTVIILFGFLFCYLEFVRLSHSLIKYCRPTCYCVTVCFCESQKCKWRIFGYTVQAPYILSDNRFVYILLSFIVTWNGSNTPSKSRKKGVTRPTLHSRYGDTCRMPRETHQAITMSGVTRTATRSCRGPGNAHLISVRQVSSHAATLRR